MRKANLRLSFFSYVLLLGMAVPGWSQVQNASLTGLVSDPSGAVVAGAAVTARDTATNVTYTTKTDSSGYYLLGGLTVGTYAVTVEMTGFKKAIHDSVVLGVGEMGRNDFQLALGAVSQVVEVKTAATALQTESAQTGVDISNAEVIDLPLGRRNWDDLLLLSSGVSGDRYTEQGSSTSSGRTAIVNVHGVRSLQNNFLLDGVDNNTISENVLELSAEVVHESVDSIQEFTVITDPYSAEYGRSPGAAIVVATKGGTNKFHGTGWEFVRNNEFDSTDFFTNRSGAPKAKYDLNQFGGNIGGPIKRDKAFFFFNYEGQRLAQGIPITGNVPTASERVGNFSATEASLNRATYATLTDRVGDCIAKDPTGMNANGTYPNNVIPTVCLDTESQNIISYLPLSNITPATGALNANDYYNAPLLLDNSNSYNVRGDVEIKANNHVFARYNIMPRYRDDPGAFDPAIIDGASSSSIGKYYIHSQGAALGDDWIISPKMINEVRLGWGRAHSLETQNPFGENTLTQIGWLGVPNNPAYDGGFPGMTVSGAGGVAAVGGGGARARMGSADYTPKHEYTNAFEENDTLGLTRGTHQLNIGADFHAPFRNIYDDVPGVRGSLSFDGQYTGMAWADFLMGYPYDGEYTGTTIVDARDWMMSYFFQDAWKVTPKLSANYGIRYDYAPWEYEAGNLMSNFNPATGTLFYPSDSPYGRSLVKNDHDAIAPRLGLAYHISPNWVIRTGYGRFYQLFERQGSEDQMYLDLPWHVTNSGSTSSTTSTFNNMRVATGNNLSINPTLVNPTTVNTHIVDPNDRAPSIDQWNFGFQRLLPGNMVLTVDYVGTKGTHLSYLTNENQNPLVNGIPTGVAPYPAWGSLELRENGSNSTYEGLETALEKKFSHGLLLRANWTWSHSIDWDADDLNDIGSPVDPDDYYAYKQVNRGNSDFDYRQVVSIGYVYAIPEFASLRDSMTGAGRVARQILRNWRLSGVTTGRTGEPFAIEDSSITSEIEGPRGGLETAYGDCFANGALSAGPSRTILHWFNTADYGPPPITELPNCGRNTLFGPDLIQFDTSLSRAFTFGEGRRLELRWDSLNVSNNTHFGYPDRGVTDGTFGQISSLSGDPRVMQFALKLFF